MQILKTDASLEAISPSCVAVTSAIVDDAEARIAVLIRALRQSQKMSVFQFSPVSDGASSSRLVAETTRGLLRLGDRPILVVNMHQRSACRTASELLEGSDTTVIDGIPASMDAWMADAATSPVVVASCATESGSAAKATPDNLAAFLVRARSRFAFTLIDTPSLLTSVDGLLTAGHTDGVILSVAAGRTTMPELKQSRASVERANGKVLGFVHDETPLRRGK